jgi:protein TonB
MLNNRLGNRAFPSAPANLARDLKETVRNESAPRENPFVRGMLEIPSSTYNRRSPLQLAASIAIHFGVIAALIVVPGYFVTKVVTQPPPDVTYVFTPPAPLPPPAAAAAARAAVPRQTTPTPKFARTQPPVAPQMIPKSMEMASNTAPPSVAPDLGIPGGVEGGNADGVLGGVLGGIGDGPAAPAGAVVRVGGNVQPPKLLKRVEPTYPVVAKLNKVQGTVVVDAVIDPQGDVVKEHAVDGPEMLVPAALDAVQQWKYQPTYLNGKAVALDMEVSVTFRLGVSAG